ncbi:hypothetical protein LPB136_03110 [Tenacibaculum todarodis]|uniref:HTH luxR-type domain-containing protein n=1 Tax=Tenacibaculum todarodis TaxID=1850252 RepID=A0A1L3JH31_9FLAO|nr:LuxR C-terminal-related transcriptional regulator [Tenacibaculum todarodis]APG64414.1 hypothetical protein LPB136_03110 [Tenacibaculum todarodis]
MKFKLLLITFFFTFFSYAQSEIYFYKDVESNLSIENIKDKEFKDQTKLVLDKHSNASYWFKIPKTDSNESYIFRIKSIRAGNAIAYKNSKEFPALKNQRYISFKFKRDAPFYIKVSSKFSAYFPVELKKEEVSIYNEKLQIFINGLYYGAAFLVIIFSINYYYFFKDIAFLHHTYLLISLVFTLVISDGIFYFFNAEEKSVESLILINYILLSFCTYKFTNSFLQLDIYLPRIKKVLKGLVGLVFLFVLLFIITKNIELYIFLNVLIFILLFTCWFLSIYLFKSNHHTKLFAFGYAIILFSGLDFFVLRNLGISLFQSNSINLKIGGFIQILILSFAVLFREKSLRKDNFYMKNEILIFSKEVKTLTEQKSKKSLNLNIENLSLREREVFSLIAVGKSNKQIASEVNISINTVKFHVKNIYEKLNIKSRKEVKTIEETIKTTFN